MICLERKVKFVLENGEEYISGEDKILLIPELLEENIEKVKWLGLSSFDKKYDEVHEFCEGVACVKRNGKWGYIDETGKEITPFIYDEAGDFCEGIALVKENDKLRYVDKDGKQVFYMEMICSKKNNNRNCVDNLDKELISVCKNNKWGYIDKTGKEVIPFIYDEAGDFHEGLAQVFLNGKYGYINKIGEEVIPFVLESGTDFNKGVGFVQYKEFFYYLNLNTVFKELEDRTKELIGFITSITKFSHETSFVVAFDLQTQNLNMVPTWEKEMISNNELGKKDIKVLSRTLSNKKKND